MNLEERVAYLEGVLSMLLASDRYTFQKHLHIFDGRNVQLGVTTGTKIGTAATQKLGFYGATPVVQAALPSAASTQTGVYVQADVQSIATLANSLRTIIHNSGLSA